MADVAHNQIISSPRFSPGCDFFTRSTRGPFIDTGVDIDGLTPNSRIYVCEDTVGEWARAFGWISPDQANDLTLETKIAVEEMTDLLVEVERLRTVESALIRAGFTLPIEPPPEDEPEEEITYPHHKGAGWWVLSNGDRIRGDADSAAAAEAALDEVAA